MDISIQLAKRSTAEPEENDGYVRGEDRARLMGTDRDRDVGN